MVFYWQQRINLRIRQLLHRPAADLPAQWHYAIIIECCKSASQRAMRAKRRAMRVMRATVTMLIIFICYNYICMGTVTRVMEPVACSRRLCQCGRHFTTKKKKLTEKKNWQKNTDKKKPDKKKKTWQKTLYSFNNKFIEKHDIKAIVSN